MAAPFIWFDLAADDGSGTSDFYQGLFGWKVAA
jgi:predicted enzyme related to lactoylglutathione lyase